VTLRDLQPEACADLDAAYARAIEILDPDLLAVVIDRISVLVTGARPQCSPRSERERAVCAVIDQELIDVAGLDDDVVREAAAHFPDGHFADVVMAAYVIEARTRLQVASTALLGGFE